MKKRSLVTNADEPPLALRRLRQLELLAGVALEALDRGKADEAERVLAPAVADCTAFAERASTPDELQLVALIRGVLAPILPRLEALTGKPWRCLDVIRLPPWKPRVPPRGQT